MAKNKINNEPSKKALYMRKYRAEQSQNQRENRLRKNVLRKRRILSNENSKDRSKRLNKECERLRNLRKSDKNNLKKTTQKRASTSKTHTIMNKKKRLNKNVRNILYSIFTT